MVGFDKTNVIFATDIKTDKDITRAKNERKSMMRIMNGELARDSEYRSIVVLTKYSKKDIEEIVRPIETG